ncbi:MAG: shikimate kinase [Acidilobaceae archaeon]
MWAFAGVSVVNAIPSGLGSTMAIDVKITVDLVPKDVSSHSTLTRYIVEHFMKAYGIPEVGVLVNSPIPSGGGLKSSSAVSVALIEAIKKRFKIENVYSPLLSAELSRASGVSITGAFDDAVAAYHGGISFTNNLEKKVLTIREPPEDIVVVVLASGNRKPIDVNALRSNPWLFEEAFSIALRGDVFKAMLLNGMTIAKLLGYDVEPIRRVLTLGAIAAGISGNGPSMFAVAKEGEEGPLIDYFVSLDTGKIIVSRPAKVQRL